MEDNAKITEAKVNQVISKAQQEAHPGDIQCVLSGAPKKKTTTQVKFTLMVR